MQPNLQTAAYLDVARGVRRRLARARFRRGVLRSHLAVSLSALLLVLLLRRLGEWRSGEVWAVVAIFVAWIALVAALARLQLPDTLASLRELDRRGGWKDCFSSAWQFLRDGTPSSAEILHVGRAGSRVEEALASLSRLFPAPAFARAWVVPGLALLFSLAPWGRLEPDFRDLALTEAMRAAALEQSEELAREGERASEIESLSEEERDELEALRAEVAAAAETLADPDGLTAGEVLELLESRAKAAERLAERLAEVTTEWASEEMLAEMARHPDTADLAFLVREKSAEGAAVESERLGDTLSDDAITEEVEGRFARTLEGIVGAATPQDFERPVGERFGNASRKLGEAQPKTAAREFLELAKHFRQLASREEARGRLEKLAEQLREAGAEVGGSELKRMEEIARAAGQESPSIDGLRALDSGASGAKPDTLPGQNLPVAEKEGKKPQAGSLAARPQSGESEASGKPPVPGAAEGEGEGEGEGGDEPKRGEQAFSAPVPGEAPPKGQNGSGLGMSDRSKAGKGKGGSLSAPVPGLEPGESAPGAAPGATSAGGTLSGQGGDQAGVGTAEMVDATSEVLSASGEATVKATPGSEGDSTFRAVEGGARAEVAGRSTQEIVTEFLAVEEQALDSQSLPMSRRQQVLRYFSALREQFESADPAP